MFVFSRTHKSTAKPPCVVDLLDYRYRCEATCTLWLNIWNHTQIISHKLSVSLSVIFDFASNTVSTTRSAALMSHVQTRQCTRIQPYQQPHRIAGHLQRGGSSNHFACAHGWLIGRGVRCPSAACRSVSGFIARARITEPEVNNHMPHTYYHILSKPHTHTATRWRWYTQQYMHPRSWVASSHAFVRKCGSPGV